MLNLLSYLPAIALLVSVGDSTDYTIPAVAAGVGIGVIAIALLARRRSKDDDGPAETPPTVNRKSKHLK